MNPSVLDDSDLWLPTEFLTDEDFLMEKENKVFKGLEHGGESKFLFPDETRSGFGSHRPNSGLGSPVDSLFGSTETESDDENFMAELTRQMGHSSMEDHLSGGFGGHHNFPADNNTKVWSQSGSPQSTLCSAGISCGVRRRTAHNYQTRAPQVDAFDLYRAAAEEMGRMSISDPPYGFNHGGRGLLGAPAKPSQVPVSAAAKSHNIVSGYYNHHSLHYQKLQGLLFQQLKQRQMMMKQRHVMQNRGRVGAYVNNGRPVGLSQSAWPKQRHAHQVTDASGMRMVFLGNQAVNRVSSGTGVFLPRRANPTSSASPMTRKKQTISTVLVPERVAQALNLPGQPRFDSMADLNDASLTLRSNNGGFFGGMKAEQLVPSNELRLPSDWSY